MFDKDKFENLKLLNLSMGSLHLIQSILMIWLSTDFSISITSSYMQGPPGSEMMATEVLFDIKLGPAIALFLLLSSVAHFYLSSVGFDWYKDNLTNHINKARWIEYFFSSSLMIVIIAMLVGITDLAALVALFVVNGSMILFGWLMESYNQKTEDVAWSPFVFGCIAGIAPWIAIAIRLATSFIFSSVQVPSFVIWIFVSIAIFFNIFAVNQFLQYKEVGPWKNYLFGEKVYIALSLVAKSLLAWQVFAGTLV